MSDMVKTAAPPAARKQWLDEIGYYDDETASKLRVLLYGPMGAGKTKLASTFPNPFFVDTDAGGKTIRKEHIPSVPCYESRGILKRVFEIVDAALMQTGPFAPGGRLSDRETFVLDSVTVFSNSAISDLITQTGKDPLQVKASFDEYGRLLNACIELGKRLKRLSLRMNVVVTALDNVDKDENTGAMIGGPALVGQYRNLIGADFDEVYYMTTEGTKEAKKHVLYTGKQQFFNAKTRLGLPYRIEDASYSKLASAL